MFPPPADQVRVNSPYPAFVAPSSAVNLTVYVESSLALILVSSAEPALNVNEPLPACFDHV